MKKRISKHKQRLFRSAIYIFTIIFSICIVPFLVNAIFKIHLQHSAFSAEWSPDGYLGYIGSLLGAAATIIAVRMTILNEKKQQEKNQILASRPWLVSETELLNSNEEIQEEANGSVIFVALNGDLFGSSKNAPYMIRKGKHEINKTDCAIKYTLENVGGNTATGLRITLDGYPLFPDFALARDHKKELIFLLPLKTDEHESTYVLKFRYGDIVSQTMYSQTEALNITKDNYGVTFTQKMDDLISAPTEEA